MFCFSRFIITQITYILLYSDVFIYNNLTITIRFWQSFFFFSDLEIIAMLIKVVSYNFLEKGMRSVFVEIRYSFYK
jgi:hypothetical protein